MPRGVYRESQRYGFRWTPERIQQLIDLWPRGLTCLAIGKIMGTGRHQVSGKANRLKLPPHPKHTAGPTSERERVRLKLRNREGEADRRYFKDPPTSHYNTLTRGYIKISSETREVRFGKETCRYVMQEHGYGTSTVFCDSPAILGKSYCPEHHAICIRSDPRDAMVRHVSLMAAG